jgi:hypothetical protein
MAVFMALASPAAFKLTRQVFEPLATSDGVPTIIGLLVHAFVFILLANFTVFFIRASGYRDEQDDENNSRYKMNRMF